MDELNNTRGRVKAFSSGTPAPHTPPNTLYGRDQ